jgi:glycosyltransferase involved in cell wall biosynthesis
MRICLFTPTFFPKVGGAEMCVDQLARNFVRRGHDVVVVAQHSRGSGKNLQGDYPVVRYPRPLSQSGNYLGVRLLLARLQKIHRFDVFNAHMAYPGGYVGQWFAKRYGAPLVITPQGGDVFYRSRFRTRPKVWSRIREGLLAADAVTAPSRYFERLLAEIAPSQERVVRIPNGVDVAMFSEPVALSALHERACGSRFVLGLGRLVPRKGFDTAIEAFAQVNQNIAERSPSAHRGFSDLKLVFAGDGTQRSELEAQARSLGLADKVVFLGTVVGSEKVALLQQCLFTLVPSVDEDNMPLVVPEALACGKPVVASRIGGIPDVIGPGRNGLLCEPGNAGEFAAAFADMLDGDGFRRMSAAARQTANELDWQLIADRYLAVYEQALAKNHRRTIAA